MSGHGPIDYNLARYVLCDKFDRFFRVNYNTNSYSEETESLLIEYRRKYDNENLEMDSLIVSIAYQYLLNQGWNKNEFWMYEDKKKIGVDISIRRTFYPATHGSQPRVMSVAEKYAWCAKHRIEAMLANRIKHSDYGSEAAYKGYLERLDKKAKSITGADIDQADIILLESTLYTLNQEKFDVLQDKYEGNRSMERILAGYAAKRGNPIDKEKDHADLKNMLVCRFMSDEEKKSLASRLYGECRSWINNDNGNGIADYVLNMAGDMFGAADELKE